MKELDEITINLHLTERCTFACAHCMTVSSPKRNPAYMDVEVFQYLEGQIDSLTSVHPEVRIRLNLVGGEPTMNLDEFEKRWNWAVELIETVEIQLEMTTNGWWLNSHEDTQRFLDIVGSDLVAHDIQLRISHSDYHSEFRTPQEIRILDQTCATDDNSLTWIAEDSVWDAEHTGECANCGEVVSTDVYVCPSCDEYVLGTPYLDCAVACLEHIYVDDQRSVTLCSRGVDPGSKLSASGRATQLAAYQTPGCLTDDPILTLGADGHLRDVCCNGGSTVRLGPIYNHSLIEWIDLAEAFIEEVKATNTGCRDCPKLARAWRAQHLIKNEPRNS